MSRRGSWPGCLAAALCCAALTSCGDEIAYREYPNASLEGKVTYNGKPVTYALVIVNSAASEPSGQGGGASTARVNTDGTYKVEHAPIGEVRIGVNTDAGRGMMMAATMAAARTKDPSKKPVPFVEVPKKFHEPTNSGITTAVKEGANKFDIELK